MKQKSMNSVVHSIVAVEPIADSKFHRGLQDPKTLCSAPRPQPLLKFSKFPLPLWSGTRHRVGYWFVWSYEFTQVALSSPCIFQDTLSTPNFLIGSAVNHVIWIFSSPSRQTVYPILDVLNPSAQQTTHCLPIVVLTTDCPMHPSND